MPIVEDVGEAFEDFEEILDAARRGDGAAFERLFRWLAPAVAGYLRARRVEDPDDLANEVFLRAFRGIARFRGDADGFRSWIFTIAHNAALDDRRRDARRPRTVVTRLLRDEPAVPDAADGALDRLGRERVEALLERLPRDQREVFLLRVLGDLSVSQTADVLGKTYEAVKALQRRGAANLKRELSGEPVPK